MAIKLVFIFTIILNTQ